MSLAPEIFGKLSRNERLSEMEFQKSLTAILEGKVEPIQISAFLLGLEAAGLTAQELQIGTLIMRRNMVPVAIEGDIIDIVGTGGTGLHTLSISTASAIVCAGAGAKVAKHGNRAASSLTGTADTLSELGVNLAITPARAAQCVEEAGLGFLFAPNHHPAMRHVGLPRKALGIRTLFNMLGPMCNPAEANRMLLGVCDDSWRPLMAEALSDLGIEHAWVVHGADGLDEISTTGRTFVSEVKQGRVREFEINPQDFGLSLANLDSLRGGVPKDNARALTEFLAGEQSAYRDIVLLNSGAALMIAGLAKNIPDGLEMAARSIDEGAASAALKKLVKLSNAGSDLQE